MKFIAAIAASAAMLAGATSSAGQPARSARDYTATHGRYEPHARFRITYVGQGEWSTVYHSNPPNPGFSPDTNDANDASSQSWSLRLLQALRIARVPPCANTCALSGAVGSTSATGSISHTHIDGIYPADNASAQCRVDASTVDGERLAASLQVRYLRSLRALEVQALIPVSEVLYLLPQQCPGQGDSIDGLADNYFTPGFSFAPGYGPDRWFSSELVRIPYAVLHRASRVTIDLAPAPSAAPPMTCAVPQPSYERCQASGTWRAKLVLVRVK